MSEPRPPFRDAPPSATTDCPATRATYGKVPGHWDLDCVLKILCAQDAGLVKEVGGLSSLKLFDEIYWEDPYYDGAAWTTRRFDGGGYNSKASKEVGLVTAGSCEDGAVTVKHEMIHQGQPDMLSADAEDDAYFKAEQWAIDRGLPSQAPKGYSFRKWIWSIFPFPWPTPVPDKAEIQRMVRDKYPVPTATSGPPPPQVVGKMPNGDTILEDPVSKKRTTRPPVKGDSYPGPETTKGERAVDPTKVKCP